MTPKNLFLVNTRFHLLIAQSIATKNNLTDLCLISTDESLLTDKYLYDSELWADSIYIKKIKLRSTRSIINFFRQLKTINTKKAVNMFWGNDYQIENQLISNCFKLNEINLFDDGIATYLSNKGHKKTTVKKVLEFCIFGLFKRFLKNSIGIGHYPHDYHFSLYPDLITNTQNCKVVAFNVSIPNTLKDHTNDVLKQLNICSDINFFLTQPITEYSVMSPEKENELLKRLINNFKSPLKTMVIKAHPSESATRHLERVNIIKVLFEGKVVSSSALNLIPIEAFVDVDFKSTFLSLYSTALINLKIMNNSHHCISGVCKTDIGLINSLDEVIDIFETFKVEPLSLKSNSDKWKFDYL